MKVVLKGRNGIAQVDGNTLANIVFYGPAHQEQAGERQSCRDQQHREEEARAQPQSRHEYSGRIAWK